MFANINASDSNEYGPYLSPDGRDLYYAQETAMGADVIMHASRSGPGQAFTGPQLVPLSPVPEHDADPYLSDDAKTIWYSTLVGADDTIVSATRTDAGGLFAPATDIGASINSPAPEYGPTILVGGSAMFFTRVDAGSNKNVFAVPRDGDGWGASVAVAGASDPVANESSPTVSADGRELIVTVGTTLTLLQRQGDFVYVGPMAITAAGDFDDPFLSRDGTLLLATENVGGTTKPQDLVSMHRECMVTE